MLTRKVGKTVIERFLKPFIQYYSWCINMSKREMQNRKEDANEKGREGKDKKPTEMAGMLKKMGVTPMTAKIMAVATSVVLAAGCGSSLTTDNRDADEDVESDAPELTVKMPPLEVMPRIPVDAETDGDVVGDVAEDGDVVGEADVEEEIIPSCEASNAHDNVRLNPGIPYSIGGLEVEYTGSNEDGDGMYTISCEGVEVGSVVAAVGEMGVYDASDGSFSVEITPSRVGDSFSVVEIRVIE